MIRFFKNIRFWFRYNFNKEHLKVVKAALMGYPFDYGFLYSLEKSKLQEMYAYFKKSDETEKCSRISLALRLLDIVIEDDSLSKTYVNFKNWERFIPSLKYSNIRYDENPSVLRTRYFKAFPGDLRTEKARYLYHKVLYKCLETWWD